MSEVVRIIPQPDGSRIIIFDDGSRILQSGTIHSEGNPGSQLEERGLGDSFLLAQDPGILGQRSIDPGNPEDLAWLRFEIEHGNIVRESRPTHTRTPDRFIIIVEHDGWVYTIGQRTGITVASPVITRLGSTPIISQESYLWGVRGSGAARTAWRRDHIRSGLLPFAEETANAIADTGIPPEEALPPTVDVLGGLWMIPQAALQSQESVRRYVDRSVARYNDEPYGVIVGVIEGFLEFGWRLFTDFVGLPAALGQLFSEVGTIFQEIQESIPDILQGLETAPSETRLLIINATWDAIVTLTGLGEIDHELELATRAWEEERYADWGRYIASAIGRVIELVLIVKAVVGALRRISVVAARMRRSISRLNQSLIRLKSARQALREGRQLAEAAEETRPRRTRSRTEETPVNESDVHERSDSSTSEDSTEASTTSPIPGRPAITSIRELRDELIEFWEQQIQEVRAQRARARSPARRRELYNRIRRYRRYTDRLRARRRPTAKQSEAELRYIYSRYAGGSRSEVPFIHGRRLRRPPYPRGHTRPDSVTSGAMLEFKRYFLPDDGQVDSLISELQRQITDRAEHGPYRQQGVVLDARGLRISEARLVQIAQRISQETGLHIQNIEVAVW